MIVACVEYYYKHPVFPTTFDDDVWQRLPWLPLHRSLLRATLRCSTTTLSVRSIDFDHRLMFCVANLCCIACNQCEPQIPQFVVSFSQISLFKNKESINERTHSIHTHTLTHSPSTARLSFCSRADCWSSRDSSRAAASPHAAPPAARRPAR
jgi:hypothetical protein